MKPSDLLRLLPPTWLFLLLMIAAAPPVLTDESFIIGERILQRMEQRFGREARERLLAWQRLIQAPDDDDRAKLERVNRFSMPTPLSTTAHIGSKPITGPHLSSLSPAKAAIAKILPSPNFSPCSNWGWTKTDWPSPMSRPFALTRRTWS
jgi:hypothetical protein